MTRRGGSHFPRTTGSARSTASTSGWAGCRSPWSRPSIEARGSVEWCAVGRLGAVLTIDQATHDLIVAHARADHPDEACGVVAGPAGSDRPERYVAMVNA